MATVAFAGLLTTGAVTVQAQDAYSFVSSVDGARLRPEPANGFQPLAGLHLSDFLMDEASPRQAMIGFGASFLEAGAISLNSLPPPRQDQVLRALFDPRDGAGFSAMKTPIGATDFQSAGPFYTYDDVPGDRALDHFSIERDTRPDGVLTYIKRARAIGSFRLQAPMDFPPDWMLTPSKAIEHALLDVLANYYLRYLDAYRAAGVDIDYLSPFNEPGMYTQVGVAEISDLIANHLGPRLEASGLRTKLQCCDWPFRSTALRDTPRLLDQPDVARFIASASYHGYDYLFERPFAKHPFTNSNRRTEDPYVDPNYHGAEFAAVEHLRENYPAIPLWMSEVTYFPPTTWVKVPVYDFADGEFWGRQIMSDVNAGASAWSYWNMILDQNGGPWLVDPSHGNPPGNAQHPVVIVNRDTHEVTYTGLYYYLAQFSRWVRPGAVRVDLNGGPADVFGSAFVKGRTRTVVLINARDEPVSTGIEWLGRRIELHLPRHSIATTTWSG